MDKCRHTSRSLFPPHSSVIFHPDGDISDNMSNVNLNAADDVTMDTGDNNTTVQSPVEFTAAELAAREDIMDEFFAENAAEGVANSFCFHFS